MNNCIIRVYIPIAAFLHLWRGNGNVAVKFFSIQYKSETVRSGTHSRKAVVLEDQAEGRFAGEGKGVVFRRHLHIAVTLGIKYHGKSLKHRNGLFDEDPVILRICSAAAVVIGLQHSFTRGHIFCFQHGEQLSERILVISYFIFLSPCTDSNRKPADYKSAALPIEL